VPEGDSLHRAALRLRPLVGHRVSASSPNPRGLATGVAAAVDGRVLESVEAVGKHLLLRFDGGITVRSHLRMNGRWRVGPAGERVGKPWLVLRAGGVEATQWNGPALTLEQRPLRRLGPDLLGDHVDAAALVGRLRRADPSMPLGVALQDQRLVAGIGNMWMSETLWAVRVSPWLAVGEADDAQLGAALAWARDAMRASVAGSRTVRAVYRRAGRPCTRCATPIVSRGQGDDNRTAYWCPGCQGMPPVSRPAGKGMPGP
jgi:endonuclease VIII